MRTKAIYLLLDALTFLCPSQASADTMNRWDFLEENKGSLTRAVPNYS